MTPQQALGGPVRKVPFERYAYAGLAGSFAHLPGLQTACFSELHKKILDIRHMLFAHADASLAIGDENYPNAVMIESDGIEPFISLPRSAIKWDALKQFLPLVEALTESTNRYRSEYVRQFVGPVLKCGKGVFRLNVVDSSSSICVKLSEAQEIAWRKKKSTLTGKPPTQ